MEAPKVVPENKLLEAGKQMDEKSSEKDYICQICQYY